MANYDTINTGLRWDSAGQLAKTKRPNRDHSTWKKTPQTLIARKLSQRKYQEKVTIAVFKAYGQTCICCGESEQAFLTIDHINGGGRQERLRLKKTGTGFYSWLRYNKFPEGYQTMCMNCNWAKSKCGICPHNKTHE